MKIRGLAAVAILLTAGLVNQAGAAPLPCNLITDAKGDTFLLRNQDSLGVYGPQEDGVDIISVDLATDAKTITGVIRVVKLLETITTSPGGVGYRLQFSVPAQGRDFNFYLFANNTPTGGKVFSGGVRDNLLTVNTKLADGTGAFDTDKNEIRISVPLSAFAGTNGGIKKGMKLATDWDTTVSRSTPAATVFADVVVGSKPYTVGAKNCVKPGK